MADELIPAAPQPQALTHNAGGALAWPEPAAAPPPARSPFERPIAAIKRYKFLVAAITMVGAVGGVVATRFVQPMYDAHGTIFIAPQGAAQQNPGAIRDPEMLASQDWMQLLKTFRISDSVVMKMKLFIQPEKPADSAMFANFQVKDHMYPGKYHVVVDRSRKRWNLTLDAAQPRTDSGPATDSIGQRWAGFKWVLPPAAFQGTGKREFSFTITTPRQASQELFKHVTPLNGPMSSFMGITLEGTNPDLARQTLNTWMNEYVRVEGELKKQRLVQQADVLHDQLRTVEVQKNATANALAQFRNHTITEPTNDHIALAPGLAITEGPTMSHFFALKIDEDQLNSDREAVATMIAANAAKPDSIPWQNVNLIKSASMLSGSPAGDALRESFKQLDGLNTQLATLQVGLTAQSPEQQKTLAAIDTIKKHTIPSEAQQLLRELASRQADLQVQLDSASSSLQAIPAREEVEDSLSLQEEIAKQLYQSMQSKSAEADLAEKSSTADVSILDPAEGEPTPSKDTAPTIIAAGIIGGLAAAIGLAILLDKVDHRLRYPEQATNELGLPIAGTVPRFPKGGIDQRSPDQMYQLVESFRTLRMSVMHAAGSPVSVAISSPAPGDGKSLISANLAMSFAETGMRTILVDGDTRRGSLHEMFGLTLEPGLTDYLSGRAATVADVVRPTTLDNLAVLPCGIRQRRSPELLTSPRLTQLVAELRSSYDVIIIDTPPLAAGIDGYSIATAAGSLLLVLRIGETERRMAAAKLQMFDRLPVNVIGAVLNGVQFAGEYAYYGYAGGYGATDAEPGTEVATT